MNVVEALIHLKTGRITSQQFRQQQATKRVTNLQLSGLQEIEDVHKSGINTMDLDKVEGR